MAIDGNEGWKGPGTRKGVGHPIPRCAAIALRLLAATERPVTPEIVAQLGAGMLHPESPDDDPLLLGFYADCGDCPGKATVDLDRVGRIANITAIPGYPSFAAACHTIAGCAVMNCVQRVNAQ